jgi:hypothetical protein
MHSIPRRPILVVNASCNNYQDDVVPSLVNRDVW